MREAERLIGTSPRACFNRSMLLRTSAMVGGGGMALASGPALAQEEDKIDFGVFGFLNNYYAIVNVDEAGGSDADFNNFATHFDGEVQFGGALNLDNGLEVGVRFELEIPLRERDDETFMWLKGGFGELRLGGDNSAHYSMGLGIWPTNGVGVPINSGWISDFVPAVPGFAVSFRSPSVSTAIDIHNDDNVITYYTPRVAGFQFGATYVPSADFSDGSPGGAPTGTGTGGVIDTNAFEYFNGWSVGGNYLQDIGAFNVGLSAGYGRASAGDAVEDAGGDDIQQVMVGGQIAFAGWTAAVSYANELDGRLRGGQAIGGVAIPFSSTEGEAIAAGLAYQTGPWGVSGSVILTEVEGALPTAGAPASGGEDELTAATISGSYDIGPGIKVAATIIYAEWDDEANGDQSGIGVASGFALSF